MIIQKIFKDNICLLSGLQRSGKSLVSAIIPSLKKIEIINKDPLLGLIYSMYQSGELNKNSTRFLLSFVLSNINYSNFIGRKINLRRKDETSIYHLLNYKTHLKNIKSNKKFNLKKIDNKKTIIFDTHNVFLNLNLWASLNKNLKIINVERNPVNLIYSWYKNDMSNFKYSPISQILLYKYQNKLVPYFAYKWRKKYLKMKELDRIINTIYFLTIKSNSAYKKFKFKNKILRIKYEDIQDNPYKNLVKIERFLRHKSQINFKKRYKKKVNIGTKTTDKILKKKLNFIVKNSSNDSLKKVYKMMNIYSKI